MKLFISQMLYEHYIACRRCSNYTLFLDLTPGFNGLGKDNCKTRRETFKFWDLVHWHWGNCMIAPVPVKQPWRIWVKSVFTKAKRDTTTFQGHRQLISNCMHYSWNSMYVMVMVTCQLGKQHHKLNDPVTLQLDYMMRKSHEHDFCSTDSQQCFV